MVRVEWGPWSEGHVGEHRLSKALVEAVFDAPDFKAEPIAGTYRLIGHGTVRGRLYRVIFMIDSRNIIGVVTAFKAKGKQGKP